MKLELIVVLATATTFGCAETPTPYQEQNEDGGDLIDCTTRGGTCTSSPDVLCDVNMQPLTAADWLNTECNGHCCVEGETNTCNSQIAWTCVPDACTGNWREVEGSNLCADGRVCCYWYE